MRVVTGLIGHPRARQASARSDKTVDAPPRPLAPADIKGGKFPEELQLAVGEMVVDPPRHRPPIHAGRIVVGEPWHHDRSHRADAALGIAAVPDVAPVIALI